MPENGKRHKIIEGDLYVSRRTINDDRDRKAKLKFYSRGGPGVLDCDWLNQFEKIYRHETGTVASERHTLCSGRVGNYQIFLAR